ncbi:MAG: hypothetical protein EON91_02750 [Brevundimonas sp.]|uniref:hypothetical protein n=1 Tax=Brevundimonas sp. TaxID=1871086 RepID=UPI001206439F|nr:hypothetical protein [Brevundimonas sp.]RZJ19133.1 MAG: hypothetical protein EON91_02750 [Brevundimonas sp.]
MADAPTPSGALAELARLAAPWAPGIAGAVLALAFLDGLTPRGRVVALAVGLASAAFIGPMFVEIGGLFWPGGALPGRFAGGLYFLTGISAMGFLPPLLGWIKRVAGDPLSLLKVRIGPPTAPTGGAT